MSTKPIQLTDDAFAETISKAKTPALVEFWAPGCGPCKPFSAIIEQIALAYAGKLVVAQVNLDQCPVIAGTFNIAGIPAMLFFHQGKMIKHVVGSKTLAQVKTDCDSFLSFCSSSATAQDTYEKAVRQAAEKKQARIAAAHAAMDEAEKGSPEMKATKAARVPLDAALDKIMAKEKAQLDAGEMTEAVLKGHYRVAFSKLVNSPPPELAQCVTTYLAAGAASMKALEAELKKFGTAHVEAEEEYEAALVEAERLLVAATPSS